MTEHKKEWRYTNRPAEQMTTTIETEIEINGKRWKYSVQPLALGHDITTGLGAAEKPGWGKEFWLDWHNIVEFPYSARMHMYLGAGPASSYSEELQRMQVWAEAIKAYNTLMVETTDYLPKAEAELLLQDIHLPGLTEVVLSEADPILQRTFDMLQFPRENGEHIPSWLQLVKSAQSDDLIKTWQLLKGQ